MKVLHETGREVLVGDWITLPDRRGRKHRYEITAFDTLMVHVIDHHNDMKLFTALPYHKLKLRSPYMA